MTLSVPGGTTAPSLAPSRTTVPTCSVATSPRRPARRPDIAPLDLVFKPLDRRAGGSNLSFDLGDIEPEPVQTRLAVIHPHLHGPVPSG